MRRQVIKERDDRKSQAEALDSISTACMERLTGLRQHAISLH